eukprot:448555_1
MSSQSSEPTQVGQVNDGPVCPVAVDKLVPIEESKIAFPNFTWNKWIAWNYHATKEKERINGYCCNRTYSTQCRTTFEKRATKATLYGKHNHFHMVSRFIFVRRTVFEDDERIQQIYVFGEIKVAQQLVDKNKGVLKSNTKYSIKKRKFEGSKVISTTNKPKNTKYSQKMLLTVEDIRNLNIDI